MKGQMLHFQGELLLGDPKVISLRFDLSHSLTCPLAPSCSMCSASIPVLRCSAHLSPGLPPCFGSLLFYCALPGCFWPASLSLSLWGPCQGCNTVIVRLLSEDVSNESPSPSSYLFTQPLHISPFQ